MAVTITRADLAARMRLGRTQTELDETDALLAEATEAVTRHAPDAPDVIHNAAVWRYCAYAYDRPFASVETRFSNVMRNSGAAAALLPYRQHRLGLSGGDDTATAPATAAGNAITGLEIVGGNIVLTFGDGSTVDVPLPPSIGGVSVSSVVFNANTGAIDVTYSDGNMVSIPLPQGGGNLQWPGL